MTENILEELLLKSECLLNIQDLWAFQNKLLCLFSSSHILWPMLIQAWSFFIPTFSTPAKSRLILLPKDFYLSQLSHFQAWLAVPHSPLDSPFFLHSPNINSHSPTTSASLVHSLRHFGARTTTLGSHPCQCPMGLLLTLRHWGTNPAFLSSSRHTPFTCPRHHVRSVISLKS